MAEPFIETFKPVDEASGFSNPLTISYARREVTMHIVSEAELNTIASSGSSVNLALLGISSGALITVMITLLSVSIQSAIAFSGFVAAAIVCFFASLFFGIHARIDYKNAREKLADIKAKIQG